MKSLFYTDRIGSFEWQDLEQFRDSPSSWRTLWSAVIKSPNFSARGRTASASASSARSPCHFGSASRLRNFCLLRSEYELLCFLDFDTTFKGRSESESWEMYAGSVSCRLSVNSSNRTGRSRKRSSASRLSPLFDFCLCFFGVDPHQLRGAIFRHFALILDLKMNLTSPALAT